MQKTNSPGAAAPDNTRAPAPKRRGRVGGVIVSAVIAAALSLIAAQPASAATLGPGFGSGTDHQGLYTVGSTNVACIEPNVGQPTGNTVDAGVQSTVVSNASPSATLSDLAKTQISAAMQKYAQGADDPTGFSLGQAVKDRANHAAYMAETNNNGYVWYQSLAPSPAAWSEAVAKYNEITAYMDSVTIPNAVPSTGTVDAVLQVDPSDNFKGKLIIVNMTASPATGTITMDANGKFVDSGTTSITGTFKIGDQINVTGVPPLNTGKDGYKISLHYDFTAGSGAPVAGPTLHVWTTAGGQTTVSAGDLVNQQVSMSGAKDDPGARQVPQISSKAQALTSPLADTSDTVTVSGDQGAFPSDGIEVHNVAYLVNSATDAPTAANQVYEAPVQTVTGPQDVTYTYPALDVKAKDGQYIRWVHQLVYGGNVIAQAANDDPNEITPIKDLNVHTIPPTDVQAGDSVQDTIVVDGWAAKNTTVVVTQYQVPLGQQLVCTPENQIGPSLNPVPITPGMNENAIYKTQRTGAQVQGQAGFVEQTYVGTTLIKTSGCLEELFTVNKPPTPPTPVTPAASTPMPRIAG